MPRPASHDAAMTTEPMAVPDLARPDRLTAVLRLPRLRPAGPAPTQRDAKRLLRQANRAYVRTHALLRRVDGREPGAPLPLGDVQANAHAAAALLAHARALPLTRAGLRAREVAWDNECVADETLMVAQGTLFGRVHALPVIPASLRKLPSATRLRHAPLALRQAKLLIDPDSDKVTDKVAVLTARGRFVVNVPADLRAKVILAAQIQAASPNAPELILNISPNAHNLWAVRFAD